MIICRRGVIKVFFIVQDITFWTNFIVMSSHIVRTMNNTLNGIVRYYNLEKCSVAIYFRLTVLQGVRILLPWELYANSENILYPFSEFSIRRFWRTLEDERSTP